MSLRPEHLRLERRGVGGCGVDRRLLPGGCVQQCLGSAENNLRVHKLGLELGDRRFFRLDVRLERSLLEPIERLILLDLGSFSEKARREMPPLAR